MLRSSQQASRSQASAAVRQVHATIPDARSPLDYGLTDSRTQGWTERACTHQAVSFKHRRNPTETFLSLIAANCIKQRKHHLPKWARKVFRKFSFRAFLLPAIEELRPPLSL